MSFAKTAFEEAYIPLNLIIFYTQIGNKPVLLYSSDIRKQDDAILKTRLLRSLIMQIVIIKHLSLFYLTSIKGMGV